MIALAIGLVVAGLVTLYFYTRACRIGKRDDASLRTLLDQTLLDDSMAHLQDYLAARGWTVDTIPDDQALQTEMRALKSIYEDGASEACREHTGTRASVCSLVGVWKMQLGTKAMVRDILGTRTSWSTERLDKVRRKDALWAWVYSRYYGAERAHDLFLADVYETVLMQTIAAGLKRGDETVLDRLYGAYSQQNRRKYVLLVCDAGALARAGA